MSMTTLCQQLFRPVKGLNRPRTRRRPPDFAPSSETQGGYVGQAVLETQFGSDNLIGGRENVQDPNPG